MLQLKCTGLILTPVNALECAEGSIDVQVKIEFDNTYADYTKVLHIGYYDERGAERGAKASLENNVFKIPGPVFAQSGIIFLSVHFSKTGESSEPETKPVYYQVQKTAGGVGSLPASYIWEPIVKGFVNDYLESNEVKFGTDTTLTQSGKAADAKAVGDEFSKLWKEKGGLDETSSKLLIKVLRNGLYAIDMSGDINTLETQLGANIVSYAITNNLTNATNSNTDTTIKEGFSYSASIVASDGYILSNVTVTMGGTDITNEVYSGGVINIPSVSGDIVINAIATISETTMYSITNTFTNVSTDNPSTSVEENGGYSATLTPTSGYLLESVTVTMGGVDITSSAYANGVVTIKSVTGNIVITAIANEPQSEEVVLLKSITGDGASYIDTEVIPQSPHRYEISFTLASGDDKTPLFGVDCYAYDSTYGSFYVRKQSNLQLNGVLTTGCWHETENNLLTNKQVYVVIKDGLQAIYLDENHTVQQTAGYADGTGTIFSETTPPYSMYLFNINDVNAHADYTPSNHTIYWFKVFDDSTNELLHEFVPAMSGAKIGMYDTVTQKFHENIGTGTFSYEEIEVSE